MRRRFVLLTAWFACALAIDLPSALLAQTGAPSHQAEPSRSLVYGGDQQFPPYEYLDDQGRPEGFNIHLIRALAREAGMSIDVRLGPREERMREFDAGQTDVMFLSSRRSARRAISCSIRRGPSRRS